MINKLFNLLHHIKLKKLLKNQFESLELREIFDKNYNIKIGLYTYGCFDTKRIPCNTVIGRYCSFASTSYIFNGNHGLNFLSLHAYLYNPKLGLVETEKISRQSCMIEDDVWVGHNAVITPNVTKVGRGSVIAAGAIVTKNVPRYAIVGGNPAKVIRYRFDEDTIFKIENSEWWLMNKMQLKQEIINNEHFIFNPTNYFRKNEI